MGITEDQLDKLLRLGIAHAYVWLWDALGALKPEADG